MVSTNAYESNKNLKEDFLNICEENNEKEFHLLYGKTIFSLYASEDVDTFNVIHSIPPNYENQAPLLFNIRDETTANIISYKISKETNTPNNVVNFTIGPMKKGDEASIYFEYYVFIKNNDYKDLPEYVKMPIESEALPDDTKIWLASTNAIQSDNKLIKLKAKQLLRKSDDNLRTYADNIVSYTRLAKNNPFQGKYKTIRYLVFHGAIPLILFRLFPNTITQVRTYFQIFGKNIIGIYGMYHDAVSVLLSYGVCSGVSNLGTALFRANGIPAKQLILIPMMWGEGGNQSFNMHCISEYYCPGYGWVWAETTLDETPREPKNAIVLRVTYPEDENIAGHGLRDFGGLEQWAWITNDYVSRKDNSWGWSEGNITVNEQFGNTVFNLTQKVWELQAECDGRILSSQSEQYFLNATRFQEDAISSFKDLDINGYYENISLAYTEFEKIND